MVKKYTFWNEEENNFLRENYLKLGNIELGKILKRTTLAISTRLDMMNLHRPKEWNSERMRKNNPMKNKEVVERRLKTLKEKYLDWGDFNIGRKSPHLTKRNLENNPMKNKESKQKMISKKRNKNYVEQYGEIVAKKKVEKHRKIMKNLWAKEEFRDNQRKLILKSLCKKPNKPETIMINIIKENNLPFNYVGDGQVIIGGFNPDFLSKNPKWIIELNGDYWHSLPDIIKKDKRKYKTYKKLGYKTLIIWEHELKNLDEIKTKIENFTK